MAGMYLIEKRGLYYRPQSAGYTGLKSEAGRYPFDKAVMIVCPNGPDDSQGCMAMWHEADAPDYSPCCAWEVKAMDKAYKQGWADAMAARNKHNGDDDG